MNNIRRALALVGFPSFLLGVAVFILRDVPGALEVMVVGIVLGVGFLLLLAFLKAINGDFK